MRRHWESEAGGYARARSWSSVDTRVLENLALSPGDHLLEIGLGSGLVASAIQRDCPGIRYFGVDLAQGFLQMAHSKLRNQVILLQASASALPFRGERFHCVLEMAAIHHFPQQFIPHVVQEIAVTLKPCGRFIAVEDWAMSPSNEREELAFSLQARRHLVRSGQECHPSDAEWRHMFEDAGMIVDHVEHVPRRINLQRFEELQEREAKRELTRLRRLWGDEIPSAKMTLFVCRKS